METYLLTVQVKSELVFVIPNSQTADIGYHYLNAFFEQQETTNFWKQNWFIISIQSKCIQKKTDESFIYKLKVLSSDDNNNKKKLKVLFTGV